MNILLVICLVILGALAGAIIMSLWWAKTMRKPGAIIGFAEGLAATAGKEFLAELCHCPFCKTPLRQGADREAPKIDAAGLSPEDTDHGSA